jgi:hypothetical protein
MRAAGRCEIDAPRTPYSAAKERQQRGVRLINNHDVCAIVGALNGEALPIVANQIGRFS